MKITHLSVLPILLAGLFLFAPGNKYKKLYKKLKFPQQYVLVKEGEVFNLDNPKEMIPVEHFFMSQTEVTNGEYQAFLNAQMIKSKNKPDLSDIEIQGQNWEVLPFQKTYHLHPAYKEYPVVNISHKAALQYCQWLTEKYSLLNAGRFKVEFKLPSENEWRYAAHAGHRLAPYPWAGYYLRNEKGDVLCNYKIVGDQFISKNNEQKKLQIISKDKSTRSASINEATHLPAPVNAYCPNDYGLYNMSGNVAEMLDQPGRTKGGSWNDTGYDVQIDVADIYEGWEKPSPYIGFRPIMKVTVL